MLLGIVLAVILIVILSNIVASRFILKRPFRKH